MARRRPPIPGTLPAWNGKHHRPPPSITSRKCPSLQARLINILPKPRRSRNTMSDVSAAIAEQFDDMPQQREASTLGMWTFLATEILFFGGMFLAYLTYRHLYPQAFAQASKHTIVLFGTINTAILLTSSLTMALAVRSAQLSSKKALVRFLLITVFLGCCFLCVKGLEYRQDLKEQLWPGPHFKNGLPPQA